MDCRSHLKIPDGCHIVTGKNLQRLTLVKSTWHPSSLPGQQETADQIALALEGKVLQLLTDLRPDKRLDWQAMERTMKHHFGLLAHANDARDKLVSRRKEEGEVWVRLCGYPTFHATVQDELALQAFIRGLQPEQLREHLWLHVPKTLSAALAESEQVEHVLLRQHKVPRVSVCLQGE